jgi:hypothetical protein
MVHFLPLLLMPGATDRPEKLVLRAAQRDRALRLAMAQRGCAIQQRQASSPADIAPLLLTAAAAGLVLQPACATADTFIATRSAMFA